MYVRSVGEQLSISACLDLGAEGAGVALLVLELVGAGIDTDGGTCVDVEASVDVW